VVDTRVSVQIAVVGGGAAVGELRAFRQAVAEIGQQRARITVDDTQAKAALASFRAETQRMNASTNRMRVEADTAAATQSVRALDAETRATTARARVMKLEVDSSQAMQQLRAYEAETRRIAALSRQQSGGGGGGAGSFALGGASGVRGIVSGEIGGGLPGVAAGAGVLALGAGLSAAAQASVELNSRLQQANITFTTFLGSTDAADAHIKELAQFAATTPFQFPDLRAIGDAEAALGGGKEGIDRVVLALGQMQVKGHIAGQEILQLTEAGIPALDYLAAAYGKTTGEIDKMITAGKVDAGTGVQAILSGLAADPRFAGMMEQQSKSFAGSMSNIEDSAQMALAKGLRPLFDELNNAATAFAAFTASTEFTKWADDFATAVHDDVSALKEMGAALSALADNPLADLLGKAIALNNVSAGLGNLSEAITGNKATRARVDAYDAGGGDLDAMKQAAQARLDELRQSRPRSILGVPNPVEVAQDKRAIQQEQETLDELDRLIARRKQQQAILDTFKGGLGFAQTGYDKAVQTAMAGLVDDVTNGRATADQARGSFDLLAAAFGKFVPNIGAVATAFQEKLNTALKANADRWNEATSAAEEYRAHLADAQKYAAMGANPEDVNRAIFGKTGAGDDATASQVARAKQSLADLEAAQKAYTADVAAMHAAAAQQVTNAWKAAESEIGRVDLSHGLSGLADALPALTKARADLVALGQSNIHLDSLVAISKGFRDIADSEKAAAREFDGFMLTFNETDASIKRLEAIKKAFDDLADAAAKKRQAGGILTPDEERILNGRTAVDANVDAQIGTLRGRQATDIAQAVQVVPDFAEYDRQVRDKVDAAGGGAALTAKVEAETTDAQRDIEALLTPNPRELTVTIKSNIDEMRDGIKGLTEQINTLFGGQPPAWFNQVLGLFKVGGATPPGDDPNRNSSAPPPGGAPPGGAFSYENYAEVTRGAPIADEGSYKTLLAVAQEFGVDARDLLAVMKTESNYGINAGLIGKQFNYGGMGVNDRGYGHDSGVHATDGGPEYAGYNSYGDFLKDLAAWIKQNGNSFANYQTADGGQAKAQAIADLRAQLPPTGTGGTPYDDPRFAQNGAGRQIVAAGMADVGMKAFIEECERWVEMKVQQVTGRRGATGQNEESANTALAHAQQMGLETNNPQPGDLVYYGDARSGHVAIYMGNGQQVSTEDVGGVAIHTEAVGPNPHYIRVPGVNDTPAGAGGVSYDDPRFAKALPPGGAQQNLLDPNTPAAAAAIAKQTAEERTLLRSVNDVTRAQTDLNAAFAGMDSKSIAAATAEFQRLGPVLEKAALAKLPAGADETQKQAARNAALAQTLQLTQAWGEAQHAIANGAQDLSSAHEKINAIVGGPLAANLNAQLDVMQEQHATADQIAMLTERRAALEKEHAAQQTANAAADRATAREQTTRQWAEQAADTARQRAETAYQRSVADTRTAITRGWEDDAYRRQQQATARQAAHTQEMRDIQDRQQAENDAFTVASRAQQDRVRYLQFYGSEQKRILSDALFDRQEAFTKNRTGENSQSQLLTAQAKGAGTNAGAESFASQNAILRDTMATEDDALKRAEEENKHLQMLEDRRAAQQSYDLETETIAQQRAHEDALQRIDRESQARGRAFEDESARIADADALRARSQAMEQRGWQDVDTAHQRSFEDATAAIAATREQQAQAAQERQWQIEDERAAQDAAYQNALQSIDDEIKAQQELATSEQDALGALQSAWDSFAQNATADLSNLADIAKSVGDAANGGGQMLPGWNPNPIRQLGETSAHAGGGEIDTPYALVGERGPEIIRAPGYTVTPAPETAAILGGGGAPTWNVTIVQQPGEDAAALWARLKPLLDQYQRAQSPAIRYAATGGRR
jgi:tape measure domain-containing protein